MGGRLGVHLGYASNKQMEGVRARAWVLLRAQELQELGQVVVGVVVRPWRRQDCKALQ